MRVQSGGMRQILDMPTTLDGNNVSTCCFFTQKQRRARGLRNLQHTSGGHSAAISTSQPAKTLRSFAYSSPHEL